jgi:hypothetical protein
MGTTALWQSTDQTSGHGMNNTGAGSRRRVREFRVGSDTFAELPLGEALIYSVHAKPTRVLVDPLILSDGQAPTRIGNGPRDRIEIDVDAATDLPAAPAKPVRKPGQTKRTRNGAPPTPSAKPNRLAGGPGRRRGAVATRASRRCAAGRRRRRLGRRLGRPG